MNETPYTNIIINLQITAEPVREQAKRWAEEAFAMFLKRIVDEQGDDAKMVET